MIIIEYGKFICQSELHARVTALNESLLTAHQVSDLVLKALTTRVPISI